MKTSVPCGSTLVISTLLIVVISLLSPPTPVFCTEAATADSLTLAGGQEGTVFKSLTVEAENRVQIKFERPDLHVDLDPSLAPGLDWGTALDILDRTVPDLVAPFLTASTYQRSPYTPRPWFDNFATGPVARFRPSVTGVDRWQLLVVDSRGEVVAVFEGKKKPPEEIAWDGRQQDGTPVSPGLTYSYVFEAYDRAGNKRRFMGDGFQIPPYRHEGENGPIFLVSGEQWLTAEQGRSDRLSSHPYLLEVASWLNLHTGPNDPLQVVATARTFAEANALGQQVQTALQPFLPGEDARIAVSAIVEPGAPAAGTLRIGPAPSQKSP